jgi:hypothetical protein
MISKILSSSTIYLLPEILHSQLNCHDYGTISPFVPLLIQIFKIIPEIDFVILIGAGGIKVRFIDSSIKLQKDIPSSFTRNNNNNNGFSNMGTDNDEFEMSSITNALLSGKKPFTMQLAELYVQKHNHMKQNSLDVCSNEHNPRPVIGAFQWSTHYNWPWKAPDALLVQTACCYEQRGVQHLFEENQLSILSILQKRLQGISGEIMSSQGIKLAKANLALSSIPPGIGPTLQIQTSQSGFFHHSLEAGQYSLKIEVLDYSPQTLEITVMEGETSWQEFVLHKPYSLTGSRMYIALFTAFILLSIVFYFLYTSFQKWKWSNNHEGFERVPLNDIDFGDDSDDDILDLRTIKP